MRLGMVSARVRCAFSVLVLSALGTSWGCTSAVDRTTDAAAVRSAVDDFWQAIGEQDFGLLSTVVAEDDEIVIFGTDAAERWVGSAAYLAAEHQMMQAFDVKNLTRRDETLRIGNAVDVAWFSTVFDMEVEIDGEAARYEGLRTTGVMEKRGDRWVIVQSHTSVPVAGQQVEYRSE